MLRLKNTSPGSTGTPSCSSVLTVDLGILFRNMSDLRNYKVFYGEQIQVVKTAKLRLMFNKNYLPEVRCCSFSVLSGLSIYLSSGKLSKINPNRLKNNNGLHESNFFIKNQA